MTTKLTITLVAIFLLVGCSSNNKPELKEIVLDHKCVSEPSRDYLEFESLLNASDNDIDISLFSRANGKTEIRIRYPKSANGLPIQEVYLSQASDRLILNDKSLSEEIGLAIFSLPKEEIVKSELNLTYFENKFCTSIVAYTFEMRKVIEQES